MPRRGTGHLCYEHDADTACKDSRQHRTCTGRWKGVTARVIDGNRNRYVVTASTKSEAPELLRAKLGDLKPGIKPETTCCAYCRHRSGRGRSVPEPKYLGVPEEESAHAPRV
jgi:hypothetical protein